MAQQPDSRKFLSELYSYLSSEGAMGNVSENDFIEDMRNENNAKKAYAFFSNKGLLQDADSFDVFYRPFQNVYTSQKKSEVGTEGSTTTLPEERVEATGPEVRDGFVMDEQGAPMRSVPRSVEAAQVQEAAAPEAGAMPEQRPVPETPTPLMKPRTAETPAPIAPGQEAAFAKAEKERQAFGFPTQQQEPDAFGQKEADFPIKSANKAIRELEQARQDRQQGQRAKPTGDREMPEIEAAFRGKGGMGPSYGSFFEDTRVGRTLSQGAKVIGATFKSIGAGGLNIPELLANTQEDIALEFANNDLQEQLKQGEITEQEYNDSMKASREIFRAIQGASAKATGSPNVRATEWVMDNYLNADELEDAARKNLQEVQSRVDNADKGFDGLRKEGRYADALQYAATQAIGSLPYMITAMLPGGAFVVGGVTAQDKYRQIQEMGGDMSATDALNAIGTGIVEGLSEAVSARLAKQAFKLVQKLGKEAAEKTLKQQLVQIGRRTVGATLEEGMSEGLAQFAENVIDKVTIDPNKDLADGVIDAVAIGALTGGALTGTGGAIGLAGRVRKEATPTTPAEPAAPGTPAVPATGAEPAAPGTPIAGATGTPTEPIPPSTAELFPEPKEAQRMLGYAGEILFGVDTELTPEQADKQIDTYLEGLMNVDPETGSPVIPTSGYNKQVYDEVMVNRDKLSQLISQQSKQKADAAKKVQEMQPQGGKPEYPGVEGVEPQAPTETGVSNRPVGGGMQPQGEGPKEGEVTTTPTPTAPEGEQPVTTTPTPTAPEGEQPAGIQPIEPGVTPNQPTAEGRPKPPIEPETIKPTVPGAQIATADVDGDLLYDSSGKVNKKGQPVKVGIPGTPKNPFRTKAYSSDVKMIDTSKVSEGDFMTFMEKEIAKRAPSLQRRNPTKTLEQVSSELRDNARKIYQQMKSLTPVARRLGINIYPGTSREGEKSITRGSFLYSKSANKGVIYINSIHANENTVKHELAHAVVRSIYNIDKAAAATKERLAEAFFLKVIEAIDSTKDQALIKTLLKVAEDFSRVKSLYDPSKHGEEHLVEFIARLDEGLRGKLLDNTTLGKIERAVNALLDSILGKGVLNVRFSNTQDLLDFLGAVSRGVSNADIASMDEALSMYASGRIEAPVRAMYWKKKEIKGSRELVKGITDRLEQGNYAEMKSAEGIVNEILAGVFGNGKYIVKFTGTQDAKGFFENIAEEIRINGQRVPSSHLVRAELLLAVNDYLQTIAKASPQLEDDMSAEVKADMQAYYEKFPPVAGRPLEPTEAEKRMAENMDAQYKADQRSYDLYAEKVSVPDVVNQDNMKGLPMQQKVSMLQERTGSVPSVAAIQTAASPDPHGMYALLETVQAKMNALSRGAVDKKDVAKAAFAHAFGNARAHFQAVMDKVRVMDEAFISTAKEGGKNYYMLDGHGAASLLLNSESGQRFIENASTAAIAAQPTEQTAQKAGMTANNLKGLYDVNRKAFGLDRSKALASAVAMDRMIGQMAKRAGVPKSEIYSKLNFKKSSEEILKQEPGVLFQIDAWHGSPYLFDKFSTEFIDKGEGAQAFGWGLYFTGLEDIADWYASELTKQKFPGGYAGDMRSGLEALMKADKSVSKRLVDSIKSLNMSVYRGMADKIKNSAIISDRLQSQINEIEARFQTEKENKQDTGEVLVPLFRAAHDLKSYHRYKSETIDALKGMVNGTRSFSFGKEVDSAIAKNKAKLAEIFSPENEQRIIDNEILYELADTIEGSANRSGIFSKEERDEIASNAARMRQIFESVSPEFKKIQKSDTSRKKYKVTLFKGKKPDQYKLIDWFGPVKQYEWLVNELNNEKRQRWFPNGFSEKETGQSLYGKLSEMFGEKGAAQFLMYQGIDGIRYPAESRSRGTEKPRGYNYVVFDEKSVSIKKVVKYQKDAVAARGAAMVGMDGQATIYALTSPNVSTPLHELAHVYEHYLSDAERKTVMSAAGTQAWTTETSEYFARGFERYLAEGVAPDNAMKRIFEKFKQWLTDIYNGIAGSEIDVALNDEMRKIYAQMLGVEPTLNKTATERDTDFEQQVADVLQPFGVNAAELFDKFYAAIQANETGGLKAAEKTLASGRSLAASILGLGDVSKKDAAALEKAIETGTPMAVSSTGIDGLDARADAIAGAVGMDKGIAREAMKNMVARHLTEEKDLEFFEDTLMLMDEEFYSQLNGRSDSIPDDIVVMNDMSTNPYGQKPYYKQARAFVWNEIKSGKSDKQIVDALQTMYSNGANGYDAREFFENVTGRKYRSQVDPVDEMMDSAFMFMRSILRLNLKEAGVAATVFRRTVPKSRLRDVAYSIDFQLGNDLAFFRKLQREVEKSMGSLMPEEMAGYQKMQLYISAAAFEIDKFAKSFYGDKKTTTASGTKDSFISRLTRSAVRSVNEFNTFLAAMHKQERMDRLIDIQERFLLQLYDDLSNTATTGGATMADFPVFDEAGMLSETNNAIASIADTAIKQMMTRRLVRFNEEVVNLKRGEQRRDKARQDFTQYLKSKGVANPATVNPDDLRAMPQFADHFAFMQEFKDMQRAYLDILREAGQLDDARYDHLVNGTSSQSGVTWKYYVPLVYDEHVYNDEMGLPNPKSERAVSRFGIKGLTSLMGKRKPQPTPGDGKPVNPLLYEDTSFEKPVEVLFHRMAGAIRFKHRNDAIRSVALTMEASQDPGFKIFSARSVPRLDRWGNPNGVTDLISPEIKKQSQVFYEGGKRKHIYFVDPDSPILAKLKSGTDDVSGIMQLFMSLNNIARGLFTYLRPSFLVANLFRDFQEAFTNVQVEGRTFNLAANAPGTPGFKKFKKQIIKAYAKRYGQSAAYLTKNLFGAQGDPQMSSYYRELQELGGLMSWSFDSMELIRDQMRTVEENINYAERYASGKSPIEATKRLFLNSSIEAVHRVSDKIEAFSRLATYAAMRDMGVEPVRAAEMAKNITLNFEKKGANKVVRAIGPLWLFLNPAVQGIRKSGKQMASSEGRKALLLYAGTSFALRGLLYSLPDMIGWFGEDEEKEKAARSDIETYIYSRYVSETKMMIPNPLDPNNPLLLPKPFGNFRVAAAAGEGLADLITGYKTPMDVAANLSNQLKGAMDPIAGTSSWANQYMEVLPLPILSPVFEAMANSDHYGRAIVYDMSGSFDYLKANRKTPQIYRDIAKGLYMHTPNHIDISPSSIEHVYESYIGLGPAQFVKNARDAWKDVAAEDAKTSKDKFKRLLIETTFINRVLYNDNISKEDKNDLYNYLSMSSQPPGRWNAQKVAYAERALEIARDKELTNERVLQSSLIDLMSQVVQSGKLYQTVPGREITWEDWYMEQASPMGEKDLIQMSEALESLIEQTGAKQQK